jgi:lipopolysaccharide/colanic/teichoic acid biosynthesis glycosyltransferase
VFYTENWSIFFDIKIIVLTALVVLTQKTAY